MTFRGMWNIKKLLGILLLSSGILCSIGFTFATTPSFQDNFANYLTDDTPDAYGRVETVFSLCIDKHLSLMDNVRNLFYPNAVAVSSECGGSQWGQLWILIRDICFILLFVFLVITWVKLIMNAKEADGPKKAFSSILFMLYGAVLVFLVTWLLGTVLNIWEIQGSQQVVERLQNTIFLQILSFFKIFAFFGAIVMMVVTGFRMMAAMDQSDKIKAARKGAINIIIALVLIKIVDYIFYIAQTPSFGTQAADMVIKVAIILWWVLGAAFVLALFYAGYMLLFSWGKEDAWKKAKSIVVNIFVIAVVIFLFLLLVYQIFNEFV